MKRIGRFGVVQQRDVVGYTWLGLNAGMDDADLNAAGHRIFRRDDVVLSGIASIHLQLCRDWPCPFDGKPRVQSHFVVVRVDGTGVAISQYKKQYQSHVKQMP